MKKIQLKFGKCKWQHIILFCVAIFFVIFRPIFISIVRGNSMLPTYHNGDILLAVNVGKINVGDVAIIDMPDGEIIKRIKYIEDDKYTIIRNKTISNQGIDMILPTNFTKSNEKFFNEKSDNKIVNLIVPKCEVYLLGDNLLDSEDSRIFGSVSIKCVRGKVIWRIH